MKEDKTYVADGTAHKEIGRMHLIDILKVSPLISGDHVSWHMVALDVTLACALRGLVFCF